MTNRQLKTLYDLIQGRIEEVNTYYLRKVAEQIAEIGTLSQSRVNLLVQMRRAGASVAEIKRRLENATRLNQQDIQRIFEQVADDAYTDAEFMYYVRGVEPPPFGQNLALQSMVRAIARQTAGTMANYARSTIIGRAYREAVTDAVQAVVSGVTDYNSAIRDTLRRTAKDGIRVTYESGYTRRLDTAVRQNVINGVRQINQQGAIIMGEQIGADGYELSAHPNSAPDHEPVQGRVLDKANFELMQQGVGFYDVDGRRYQGFERPISEWNCRHFASPFLLNVSTRRYTPEQLDKWAEDNAKGCTIGGKHYTTYEASQKMREIETAIRGQRDIADMAKRTGDDVLKRECQAKITRLRAQYNAVARAAGLRKEYDRAYVRINAG